MIIPIQNNNLALKIAKETGSNIIKIAGLYLVTQTMQSRLREISRETSEIAAQGLKRIRSKYEDDF